MTPAPAPAPLPCPFCGSRDVTVSENPALRAATAVACCHRCGAAGPPEPYDPAAYGASPGYRAGVAALAVRGWNDRRGVECTRS